MLLIYLSDNGLKCQYQFYPYFYPGIILKKNKKTSDLYDMRSNITAVITCAIILNLFIGPVFPADGMDITELRDLDLSPGSALRLIRNDVRKTIQTVKGKRPAEQLPGLTFYRYRLKKDDNFWRVLSRCSMNIDTLMSVNRLGSPRDIRLGDTIFIPNMRGIIVDTGSETAASNIIEKSGVDPSYICRVNRTDSLEKKYLFIPCGTLSSLEKSLFLGTAFLNPLEKGRKTSGFGTRRNPFNGRIYEFHSGIDIACPMKSKVYSARDGVVTFTGYRGGYGLLTIIKHEHGYRSYYGHLSRALVRPGQKVRANELIALSGNSGRTTGPHLHFEIRKGKRPVNPGLLVRR